MPVSSHFEIEPLILQVINDLALAGLKTVSDETVMAGVKNVAALLPAVILYSGDGQYSQGIDGGVQTETQYWQISVMVKHINASGSATTASDAGQYMTPVLNALVGNQINANFSPLEIVERPVAHYDQGFAEFPIVLKTSFDVGAGA
jgi:hypothetical protein